MYDQNLSTKYEEKIQSFKKELFSRVNATSSDHTTTSEVPFWLLKLQTLEKIEQKYLEIFKVSEK